MDVVCGGLRGAAANKSRRAAYTRSVLKQWTASVAVAGAGGAAQLNAAAGAHYDFPPPHSLSGALLITTSCKMDETGM